MTLLLWTLYQVWVSSISVIFVGVIHLFYLTLGPELGYSIAYYSGCRYTFIFWIHCIYNQICLSIAFLWPLRLGWLVVLDLYKEASIIGWVNSLPYSLEHWKYEYMVFRIFSITLSLWHIVHLGISLFLYIWNSTYDHFLFINFWSSFFLLKIQFTAVSFDILRWYLVCESVFMNLCQVLIS